MKRILSLALVAALLAGCANTQLIQKQQAQIAQLQKQLKVAPPALSQGFTVTDEIMLSIEYKPDGKTVLGITPYGPTAKEAACNMANAASNAQGNAMKEPGKPKDHSLYWGTCMPIVFKGPLAKPAAALVPPSRDQYGQPLPTLFWILMGVEYDAHGHFVRGTEHPPGPFHDTGTCMQHAKDDIAGLQTRGAIVATDSLIVYCVPIPPYANDPSQNVDFKLWDRGCFWNTNLSDPCEMRTRLNEVL